MFEGAWRVARQQELIAEMSARGIDVADYLAILSTFQETLRLEIQHVQQIKKELYGPANSGAPFPATRRDAATSEKLTLVETQTVFKDAVRAEAPNPATRKTRQRERRRLKGG